MTSRSFYKIKDSKKKEKGCSFKVLIFGNPNVGKTSIFNFLTASSKQTGNWHGVTVTSSSKSIPSSLLQIDKEIYIDTDIEDFEFTKCSIEVIDVPGVYDINNDYSSTPMHEKQAIDLIHNGTFDLILFVIDFSNLYKSLFLLSQIREIFPKILVVLNNFDKKHKLLDTPKQTNKTTINVECLNDETLGVTLGTDCFELNYLNNKSRNALLSQIKQLLLKKTITSQVSGKSYLDCQVNNIDRGEKETNNSHRTNKVEDIQNLYQLIVDNYVLTYKEIKQSSAIDNKKSNDKFFTRNKATFFKLIEIPIVGVPLFLAIMLLILFISTQFGIYLQDFFEQTIHLAISEPLKLLLLKISAPRLLVDVVYGGICLGIETVFSFVPLLLTLFIFTTYIEESGYLGRFSNVIRPLISKFNIPEEAVIPMVISFGCSVPGVLATQTIKNPLYRKITACAIPFVPCGAKFVVFVVLCSIFFSKDSWIIISLLYLCSFSVMFSLLYCARYFLLTKESNFEQGCQYNHRANINIDYHLPCLSRIFKITYAKIKLFINNACRMVIFCCTLLKILMSLDFHLNLIDNPQDSIIATIAQKTTKFTRGIGIEKNNWEAVVALVSGGIAKESILVTLSTLYSAQKPVIDGYQEAAQNYKVLLSEYFEQYFSFIVNNLNLTTSQSIQNTIETNQQNNDQLSDVSQNLRQHIFKKFPDKVSIIAYLLFILFYFPCISIYSSMKYQLGKHLTVIVAISFCLLGYILASIFYFLSVGIFSTIHPIISLIIFIFLVSFCILPLSIAIISKVQLLKNVFVHRRW